MSPVRQAQRRCLYGVFVTVIAASMSFMPTGRAEEAATPAAVAAVPPEGPEKSAVALDPATSKSTPLLDCRFLYLSIRDQTLEQAAEAIRSATHANIVVETERLTEAGYDLKRTIRLYLEDIPVEDALAAMLSAYGRDVSIRAGQRNGILVISTPDGAAGTTTRLYDVRLLVELFQAAHGGRPYGPAVDDPDQEGLYTREACVEEVVKMMQEVIDADSWRDNGGSDGAVREVAFRLLVTHTPDVQKRIETFLKDLEKEMSRPMPPRAATQPVSSGRPRGTE